MIEIQPSHVAMLVPSVRKAADYLRQFDFQIGTEENWDGEGTREIYVEHEKANSLLLVEPIKSGPYQRALEKRGPGLHHLAIDVLNLENYVESLAGSGWLLHPASIKTMKNAQTAYLARPGFPALIEVHEHKEFKKNSLFVDRISIPLESKLLGLIKYVGLEHIIKIVADEIEFSVGRRTIKIKELL